MNEQEVFKQFFYTAVHLNLPVALWRLPYETKVTGIVDLVGNGYNEWSFDSVQTPAGYVLQGFDTNNEDLKIFIHASVICLGAELLSLNPDQKHLVSEELWNRFNEDYSNQLFTDELLPSFKPDHHNSLANPDYQNIVQKAVTAVENQEFKKVVLARNMVKSLKTSPLVVHTFFELCQAYPNAYVSLNFHPSTGCWIGASPELLLSINKENIFKTVALAGTQKVSNDSLLADIVWSHKEIEEQALVARYIINCFKAIRLREYEDIGPRTVMAGSLAHLQTDFEVDMVGTGYPNLATLMLSLLHPTSAVCGMPKQPALDFINAHENLNRSLFSGYCGPIHFHNQCNLYVNLRCACVYANAVLLYAGAGITKDSKPEKEWEETNAKMETIGRFFI